MIGKSHARETKNIITQIQRSLNLGSVKFLDPQPAVEIVRGSTLFVLAKRVKAHFSEASFRVKPFWRVKSDWIKPGSDGWEIVSGQVVSAPQHPPFNRVFGLDRERMLEILSVVPAGTRADR